MIIEDEQLAQMLIAKHLSAYDQFVLVATCKNVAQAQKVLLENSIDIIFLDINLPKTSGIDFIKTLEHPPMIVITTAYAEYAVTGFDLNVIDYILKPVTKERFHKAIEKIKQAISSVKMDSLGTQSTKGSILIRTNQKLVRIEYSEILFVEGLHKYIKIYTTHECHIVLMTMSNFEQGVPSTLFYRCHKSYIIALLKVQKIEGNMLFINTYRIPISRAHKKELLRLLGTGS
jgi:DNA-binding LytR/AlgR family response regulator